MVCPQTAKNPSQRRFVSQPLDFVGVRFRGLTLIPWSLVRIQAGPVLQINELDFYDLPFYSSEKAIP